MKDDPPVRYHVKPGNRRQFLAGSAAGIGALILGDSPESPRLHSSLAYAFTARRPTKERTPPNPISLSWVTTEFGTCSVRTKSHMFPHGPEVVVNIEGCIIGVLSGAFPSALVSRGDTNRATNPFGVSIPFCMIKKAD